MITRDKNQYCTPKFRLILRFSNKNISCQAGYTILTGDKICSHAYTRDLSNYGLTVGMTNYSAAYCVGLLCARRCLSSFGLDKIYSGVDSVTGSDTKLEPVYAEPRPFTLIIDTGLKRTSTGSKLFGILKGALDGGVKIHHNEKRFVGYEKITNKYEPDLMRRYIFGSHVSDFMEELEEEEPDSFRRQFSQFIKQGVKHSDLEQIYDRVHKAIRANPTKHIRPKRHISLLSRAAREREREK
jgi:large subunit ribosomal protein L5e